MTDVNNYLENSIASGTLTQYKRSWEKWITYSVLHEKPSLPASPEDLASFLVSEREAGESSFCLVRFFKRPILSLGHPLSHLERLNSAVAFYHRKRFLDSPTSHQTILMLMRSFRRLPQKPRRSAVPMTENDLAQMAL